MADPRPLPAEYVPAVTNALAEGGEEEIEIGCRVTINVPKNLRHQGLHASRHGRPGTVVTKLEVGEGWGVRLDSDKEISDFGVFGRSWLLLPEDEVTFRVPMENPPPSVTQLVELTEISAMFSQPTPHGGTMTHNEPLPLRPGEVVRVTCSRCNGYGKVDNPKSFHITHMPLKCPDCDGEWPNTGHLDLKILTATPERWCGNDLCEDGYDKRRVGRTLRMMICPACHGEPHWSRWLYTARREES